MVEEKRVWGVGFPICSRGNSDDFKYTQQLSSFVPVHTESSEKGSTMNMTLQNIKTSVLEEAVHPCCIHWSSIKFYIPSSNSNPERIPLKMPLNEKEEAELFASSPVRRASRSKSPSKSRSPSQSRSPSRKRSRSRSGSKERADALKAVEEANSDPSLSFNESIDFDAETATVPVAPLCPKSGSRSPSSVTTASPQKGAEKEPTWGIKIKAGVSGDVNLSAPTPPCSIPWLYSAKNSELVDSSSTHSSFSHAAPFIVIDEKPAGYLRYTGQDDNSKYLALLRRVNDYDGSEKPLRKTVYELTKLKAVCMSEEDFKLKYPLHRTDHFDHPGLTAGELSYLEKKCNLQSMFVNPVGATTTPNKNSKVAAGSGKPEPKKRTVSKLNDCESGGDDESGDSESDTEPVGDTVTPGKEKSKKRKVAHGGCGNGGGDGMDAKHSGEAVITPGGRRSSGRAKTSKLPKDQSSGNVKCATPESKTFACGECSKICTSAQGLGSHMTIHRKNPCPECGQVFTLSELASHTCKPTAGSSTAGSSMPSTASIRKMIKDEVARNAANSTSTAGISVAEAIEKALKASVDGKLQDLAQLQVSQHKKRDQLADPVVQKLLEAQAACAQAHLSWSSQCLKMVTERESAQKDHIKDVKEIFNVQVADLKQLCQHASTTVPQAFALDAMRIAAGASAPPPTSVSKPSPQMFSSASSSSNNSSTSSTSTSIQAEPPNQQQPHLSRKQRMQELLDMKDLLPGDVYQAKFDEIMKF